jgi:hypothetical protein
MRDAVYFCDCVGSQFAYTRTFDGRNTGVKKVGGVTVSVPIQVR